MFKKINKLIVVLNLHHSFVAAESTTLFLFFDQVRFTPVQLMSSPPFLLSGATSPPVDVATPSCHVTLSSHGVKMISLALLHLLTTLRPVASSLELKSKH
jgi:hypothetical protein